MVAREMEQQNLVFHIVDVFADSKYSGNQLAVFRKARALSGEEMQRIAREINFSETTFITSDEDNSTKKKVLFDVRIFTPAHELPFAGHPTLGTAFVIQQFILREQVPNVTLNLKIGHIHVTPIYNNDGSIDILWMKQNQPNFGRKKIKPGAIVQVLGIRKNEIDQRFPIQEVSTGVPFIIVPLKNIGTLKRCVVQKNHLLQLVRKMEAKAILVFCPEPHKEGSDLSVRVFTDYYGIPEDPATGSGNGCLAGYLSKHRYFGKSEVDVQVDQGYEIGRPSTLYLKAENAGDRIDVSVGGRVITVAECKLAS